MPRNDHAVAYDLIRRADVAGAHVLVLTFDSGARTKRARDLRNSLIVPFRLTLRTLFDIATSPAWAGALRKHGVPRFANFAPYLAGKASVAALAGFAQSELTGNHTWDEIARIRDRWKRPLVLKGVMHPLDAEQAVALGLDGVIVSNHGGRVLEGAVATIDVLPAIVAQTAGRAVVMMDSGIRSGLDVVRALALGANAAFAGRPFLYALAALGAEGARHVVELFTEEIRTALAQTGAQSVSEAGGISMRHRNAMSAADFAGAPALAPEAEPR
jgi:L-lactate dehydrogenase (cytochrome)